MTPPYPESPEPPRDPAAALEAVLAVPDPLADAPTIEFIPAETTPAALPRGPGAPGLSRQIWILALPMLGEQVGNFTVGLVDTWLAGHLSKEATAAVGTAAYVGWFVGLALLLLSTGAAALVSRSCGAGDRPTANRALNQAFLIMLALGLGASVVAWLAAPWFATFLGQTEQARDLFVMYLRIDAFSYLALAVLTVVGTVLRASGDTRTPMAIMLLVNVVNVLVASSLVFGWFWPSSGVRGIAFGTLTARCVGGVLALVLVLYGWRELRLGWHALRVDWDIIWRMLRIGLPGGGDAALMATSQLFFIWIIAHTASGAAATANYAAHMIAVRMEAITYLPAMAWMTAAATLVGQYLGARQPDKAARAAHVAVLQGALLTTGVAVAFFLLADPIFTTFSGDAQVRAVGVPAFRLLAFAQPFLCTGIIYIGALRGAGDTRYTMAISLIAGLCVRVPAAYLGGIVLGGGLIGAWCGMWADNLVRLLLALGRYLHGGWKRIKV